MEAWLRLSDVIVGAILVILGWGLNQVTQTIAQRRKANRDLKAAAFVCLDRLLKIKNAVARSDDKQRDHEIYLLGSDLDRYRNCIAASPTKGKRHWPIYRKMMSILLEHDLSRLDEIIAELETVSGVTNPG